MCIDKYYLLIVLLINTQFIHAQTYTSINYSVNQGLPSNEVYQAYQDKEGFIWLGTDNGVVKFDGEEMRVLSSRDGLSDPVVFGFQEDESGKLWLKTYSGMLSYIDNGKMTEYPFNSKLASVMENSLMNFRYSTTTKELHFMVRAGKGTIDSSGTLSFDTLMPTGFHYNYQQNIWTLNYFQNNLQATLGADVYKIKLAPNQPFSAFFGEARVVRRERVVLFSIKNHLFQYDREHKELKLIHIGRSPIISLSIDGFGNLWVGYLNSGFDRFTNNNLINPLVLSELNQLSISSVLHDSDGGYWITTLEQGIFYYPNLKINNYPINDKSKILNVDTIGKNVIIGTQQGDLLLFDTQENKLITEKHFDSPIHTLITDPFAKIWTYVAQHLFILDSDLNILEKNYTQATNISTDKDGIWTQGGKQLKNFTWSGEQKFTYTSPLLYRSLLVTDSSFILAGRVGLESYSKDLSKKTIPEHFKNIKVKQVEALNDTLFLVNTLGNGLMVANKDFDVLQTFNKDNHFVADNIYSTIVSDTLVLVGTEEGLIIIKKKSLITGKPDYLQWSEQDGLIDNMIRFIAFGHQSVWAFTDNGYSIIPLDQLFRTKAKPKGYIKKLEVNDSPTQLNTNTRLSLSHDQTKLTIHIGFLSFNNKVLKIRYRLNALNPWIISKDRILQFSSVAPGDYNLEVEYSIDNVNWHSANITLPFTVRFPWWQRWYSIVAGIGIVLIGAILIFKRRLNFQKKQNELLQMINKQQTELVRAEVLIAEKERKRLAKELHDSIGTQLTAIKLNIVNILNNRNQPDNLKKIDEHLQITIDEVRSMAYSLTPPEIERYGLFAALSNHFDKITQTSGVHVDFSTYGTDIQSNELSISIFRIVQELSSNTIKHTKAKNIKVSINSFEQTVNILYEDDGGGFAPEKVKNGLGLSNIASRVRAIGGVINFESTSFGVSYVFEFPK